MIDTKALKQSKKAKSKALKGAIVLKKECPSTDTQCEEDCENNVCHKL